MKYTITIQAHITSEKKANKQNGNTQPTAHTC